VVLDPVSVPKARRVGALLAPARPLLAVTPNSAELCALVDDEVPDTEAGIARAAHLLHDLGVTHVWVRRGTRGSLLSSRDDAGDTVTHALPAPRVEAVDVTGAGDAMTAAFVHALARGDDPARAATFGQMAAALTVASPDTVRPDLTARLIDAELHRAGRRTTEENR
jgi:pseudouridine kinase